MGVSVLYDNDDDTMPKSVQKGNNEISDRPFKGIYKAYYNCNQGGFHTQITT